MVSPVTDPDVLRQLDAEPAKAVTDPALLAKLEGPGEEHSVTPVLLDRFKQGVSNLAGMTGMPVDAVNLLAGSAPNAVRSLTGAPQKGAPFQTMTNTPIGGSEQITRGWEQLLGVKKLAVPKDIYGGESKSNEYMATIAEFLGGMLVPGVGATVAAERKVATAVTVSLGTAASGMGAVEGKELGRKFGPSFGLTPEQGERIGETAGSFTGPTLVGKASQALLKAGNFGANTLNSNNINGFSKESQKAAANTLLAKDLQEGLQHAPHSEANLARTLELSKKIPEFAPTVAQATGSPSLVALQKEVSNKSAQALSKAAAADARNVEAIANYKEKVFPKTEQSLTDPARIKLATDRSVLDMAMSKNERELRALSDKFRRTVDNESIGEQLRSKYWQAREVAKEGASKKLADVYATARKYHVTEDMTDVRESVQKIVAADRTTFQDMPPTFNKILNEYPQGTPDSQVRKAFTPQGATKPLYKTETVKGTPGKSEASFEEMHSLYKQANKDWADAVASGNNSKAHYMKMVKEQLAEKVSKYNSEKYGELATRFRDYNQTYAKYSHTFKEGAGGEISKRTRAGIATDSEDIVSKVILQAGDKKRGVQDFMELYGHEADAGQLLHEGLLDNFSKSAVKNGQLQPAAARAWLARHHSAMTELPETARLFGNAERSAQALLDRRMLLNKQRQILDRTVLAKIAKSEKPEALVEKALREPAVMKGLLVGAHTQESRQAIARAIVDTVGKQGQSLEFLKQHESTLRPVLESLGKGHWQNLQDIAEMEQISARVKAPTQVELSKLQDLGEQTIGTSVKGMFSRLRNMDKPMGVSKEYMLLDVGGRFFYKIRSEELARLREDAMTSPETARLLASMGKRDRYTKGELLDLQHLSFLAGVNSVAHARGAK